MERPFPMGCYPTRAAMECGSGGVHGGGATGEADAGVSDP